MSLRVSTRSVPCRVVRVSAGQRIAGFAWRFRHLPPGCFRFEAAALYSEETCNRRRSVPVATYRSVVLITAFFALVSWAGVGGIGAGRVASAADARR
jgi:hypothetical protein